MHNQGPPLTVDCVVFDGAGRLLLIRRGREPFKGRYALPGGFVDLGETVETAALRELREETGVVGQIERLIGVYSDPKRDPRGPTVSVAFLVKPITDLVTSGDDAEDAAFIENWRGTPLAFDHEIIVRDALQSAAS
ncbi:MAG: NUDIX domain-containing protein [Hyphomonadaceae bacterium]